MGRLAQLATFAFAALGVAAKSSVVDLKPNNFDDVVLQKGTPALVEFFAPWCGHCKNLAPVYEELASSFEHAKNSVTIAKVDADAEKGLGTRFDIKGFPTLLWFDGKSDKPETYSQARDLESLSSFITEKTGVKPKFKKEISHVTWLSDSTFPERVGADKDAFVAFTTSWCGHCKQLAPVWESLAQDFSGDSSIIIGKVDCESAKKTAERFDVKSYPTILYFPKGSTEPEPYTSARSEEALLSFVNEKTGLHRIVGGGLDAIAGTIPSLDELAANLKTGGVKAYGELEAAAAKLQDKYATYYAKVARKVEVNKAYAQRELERLQGMIKKGGIGPEKLDDLTSRSNILNKFIGEPEASPKAEL